MFSLTDSMLFELLVLMFIVELLLWCISAVFTAMWFAKVMGPFISMGTMCTLEPLLWLVTLGASSSRSDLGTLHFCMQQNHQIVFIFFFFNKHQHIKNMRRITKTSPTAELKWNLLVYFGYFLYLQSCWLLSCPLSVQLSSEFGCN